MTFVSFAQNFEDVMLWRALKHVKRGFWIDVGAADPDQFSVTRAFSERGWHGINIEPNPALAQRLSAARPHDVTLAVAVGAAEGSIRFFEVVENTAVAPDATGLSTVNREIAAQHRAAGWAVAEREVPLRTLAAICAEQSPREIHFLKVDVEGAERDVLTGADFSRHRPWIVVVEATVPLSQAQNHEQWEQLLLEVGYRFAWFDGLNRFYVAAERWEELSPAFTAPPNIFDDFVRVAEASLVARITAAEARAAEAEAAVVAADKRLLGPELRAKAAEAQAAARAVEHEARLAQVYASTSWRLTGPVRAVGYLLRGRVGLALHSIGFEFPRIERLKQIARSDGTIVGSRAAIRIQGRGGVSTTLERSLGDLSSPTSSVFSASLPKRPTADAVMLWFDVEDLFQYAQGTMRPSGIQRLSYELYAALQEAAPERIGFVRHDPLGATMRVVDWAEVKALYRHMIETTQSSTIVEVFERPSLGEFTRPGDVLVVLGSPWSHPDYAGFVGRLGREHDLRFALLVYDLIPTLRPEFCDHGLVEVFTHFIRGCLPLADRLFAISEATARDAVKWAAREGIALRDTPQAIPIGTGFTHTAPAAALPQGLEAGGYALFVSTVEARKNHQLAFRAWRQLLEERSADRVPTLVFAGRIGWMVADLMQQIGNSDHLGGKLVIVENPDDATLAALYQGARFTLFPSLYEGWGLPVSESLAFGKVCLASDRSSIPEAGGDFCLYHDPDSVTDALRLYRRVLDEPDLIADLEARIAKDYRPTPWSAGAKALLEALG